MNSAVANHQILFRAHSPPDALEARLARLDRHAEHIELTVAAFEPKLEHLEADQRQIAQRLEVLAAIQQDILARLTRNNDESHPSNREG